MPTRPTILFASFDNGSDPLRQSWARFREQVNIRSHAAAVSHFLREDAPVQPSTKASVNSVESGIWRLLAPNNRELGRSSFLYTSFAASRRHVLEMQQSVEEISIVTVRGPVAGSYGWFASFRGKADMTCSRWFSSASASRDASMAAVDALANALIGDLPSRTTSSGRRTTRSTSAPSAW